jgi:hypothetical protein
MDHLRDMGFITYDLSFSITLIEGLIQTGQLPLAAQKLDDALERGERFGEVWLEPEFLRLRGLLESKIGDLAASEQTLRRSVQRADELDALFWMLRAAHDLASLLKSQDRRSEALRILEPVYSRFSEGFSLPDLSTASHLLTTLRQSNAGKSA